MTDDPKALIAEARQYLDHYPMPPTRDTATQDRAKTAYLVRRLADALERATGEGATVKIYNPYGMLIEELAPGEEYHESMDYE